MRALIITILFFSYLFCNEQDFWDYNSCRECHRDQVAMWERSWHRNSHVDNNELYSKAVEYVAKQTGRLVENIIVECGTCHNPHLDVKQSDEDYIYAKMLDLQTEKVKLFDSALRSKHVQTGISCYVCHKIDEVKEKKDDKDVGYKLIKWLEEGKLAGPFKESNRTQFHGSVQREHFLDSNLICSICHQGFGNANKHSLYNTVNEKTDPNYQIECIECHMGSKYEAINAAKVGVKKAEIRLNRPHLFLGARNLSLLKSSVIVDVLLKDNVLKITNVLAPHGVPTGFSGRNLVLEIAFLDEYGNILTKENTEFKAIFLDKNNKPTLSYTAVNKGQDTRLKYQETREIKFYPPKETKAVQVFLKYYVFDLELNNVLNFNLSEEYLKPQILFNQTYHYD